MTERYRYQIHPAPHGSTELEDRLNFFGATGRRVVQVITTSDYWWLVVETPYEPGEKCPRCGKPMHKVQVPVEPGDDSWVWGHDCEPLLPGDHVHVLSELIHACIICGATVEYIEDAGHEVDTISPKDTEL